MVLVHYIGSGKLWWIKGLMDLKQWRINKNSLYFTVCKIHATGS